jgi:competence protein ComEC
MDHDLLMAPHHGSAHGHPMEFAAWCQPEEVVISGGRGRESTVVRVSYESAGARVWHTAYDGAIEATIAPSPPESRPPQSIRGGELEHSPASGIMTATTRGTLRVQAFRQDRRSNE